MCGGTCCLCVYVVRDAWIRRCCVASEDRTEHGRAGEEDERGGEEGGERDKRVCWPQGRMMPSSVRTGPRPGLDWVSCLQIQGDCADRAALLHNFTVDRIWGKSLEPQTFHTAKTVFFWSCQQFLTSSLINSATDCNKSSGGACKVTTDRCLNTASLWPE